MNTIADTSNNIRKVKHSHSCNRLKEVKFAAQKTQQSSSFRRNNPPHQNKFSTVHIGNLSDDTTFSDLYKLFGLPSTQYLSENSYIQPPLLGHTG